MSNQRKIYWSSKVPDELKELLADTQTIITQQEAEKDSCLFRLGGPNSNLYQRPVDWNLVKKAPVAFISDDLLEWDIPKLIIKRFLAGEGGLGPEDSYQGILLKNNSLKIMDANSLGYFSDVLTATASELRINSVNVRSFCVMLLSYFEYLNKAELISYPLEVDYGLSQDSFFVQVHCENTGVFLENLLDSTKESELDNPFVSLLGEVHKKTDLMEVYTLSSSGKFVITACWVGNPHFIKKDFYNNLIIHQIDTYKASQEKFGKIAEAQTFHKEAIANISKQKVVEKLPQRYKKQRSKKIEEVINPVLVKRIVDYVFDKNNGKEIDWESYTLEQLAIDSQSFPDKEAFKRLNDLERQEVLKVLAEGEEALEAEVENVKKQIDTDDYLTGLLNSLNNMSLEEAIVAADLEDEEQDVITEALGEVGPEVDLDSGLGDFADEMAKVKSSLKPSSENQRVSGIPDGIGEEGQRVRGAPEDLGEESQRVHGNPEDLTEEIQRVAGAPEDHTEHVQKIAGNREQVGDSIHKVSGVPDELNEELQKVKAHDTEEIENEDSFNLGEDIEKISAGMGDFSDEIQKVKSANEAEDSFKQVVKGANVSEKPKSVVVKGEKKDLKEDTWQLKRLNVVKKVKEKISSLKEQNANHSQIDLEVKNIISTELGLDEEKSSSFIQALSDDVSDDFIHEGIDSVNENIKNRIRAEKMANQLSIRDKQVEKMKELIAGLKTELSHNREELLNLRQGAQLSSSELAGAENLPFDDNALEVPMPEGFDAPSTMEAKIPKSEVDLDTLRSKNQEISKLKEELAQATGGSDKEILEEELKGLKASNLEVGRENEKLSNEVAKLQKDNELLLKKFREGMDEVNEIRDSDQDAGALKEKNVNLEAQVEKLKNKISFLYENSKSNKEIEVSANEVQKLVEDKERFFNEKMAAQEEVGTLKSEMREKERIIKQKDLEIAQKSDLLQNKPVGEEADALKQKDVQIAGMKQEMKQAMEELKATQLKTKSFEQKVKFLNAQLQKYQGQAGTQASKGASAVDAKVAAKLKQAEVMNGRLKDAADKYKSELGEKKTELHKAKLEAKTMSLKIRDLEKKLLNLAKKKAA